MNDWKPVNLCTDDCKSRDSYCPPRNRFGCASYERYQSAIDAQRKLLEYLIAECKYEIGKGLVEIAETIYKARLIRLESMLKQLEERK